MYTFVNFLSVLSIFLSMVFCTIYSGEFVRIDVFKAPARTVGSDDLTAIRVTFTQRWPLQEWSKNYLLAFLICAAIYLHKNVFSQLFQICQILVPFFCQFWKNWLTLFFLIYYRQFRRPIARWPQKERPWHFSGPIRSYSI